LTEAHISISQTSQSLCFVNNYSASTYKNSLTAWTLDSQESMSWWDAANIQEVREPLPSGTKIYKGRQSDSGIFRSLVDSVLMS